MRKVFEGIVYKYNMAGLILLEEKVNISKFQSYVLQEGFSYQLRVTLAIRSRIEGACLFRGISLDNCYLAKKG
jgi:hypothetical protein